jgi:MFS family permease
MGVASMIQFTATNTLIQSMTPDALRGRVMAIWFMIFMGFAPIGSLIAGSVTTAVGPRLVLAVGGTVCALGAIGFARWSWTRRPVTDGHTSPVAEERRAAVVARESREPQPVGALETRR